jgi:hypothetical protein
MGQAGEQRFAQRIHQEREPEDAQHGRLGRAEGFEQARNEAQDREREGRSNGEPDQPDYRINTTRSEATRPAASVPRTK